MTLRYSCTLYEYIEVCMPVNNAKTQGAFQNEGDHSLYCTAEHAEFAENQKFLYVPLRERKGGLCRNRCYSPCVSDEFESTGEIMPVVKKVGTADGVLFMGSRVVRGSATSAVVALGEHTEYSDVLRQNRRFDHYPVSRVHLTESEFLCKIEVSGLQGLH